ncbi:neutrophil defensin 3 [Microcebus murinus]|uniref:Mammalian defensins domain-containing protein n=1 Tax=Microcebus murinus TaxID=30608 RepID=A0A8C5XFH8_MICMU
MKTLALLAALLLLALQAQAGPLQERDEEMPLQELPVAEDRDVSISITWNENSIPQAPVRSMACACRRPACLAGETRLGTCHFGNNVFVFCC